MHSTNMNPNTIDRPDKKMCKENMCKHIFSFYAKCGHTQEEVQHKVNCLYKAETFMTLCLPPIDYRCSPARQAEPQFCESENVQLQLLNGHETACPFCRPGSIVPSPAGVLDPEEIKRRTELWKSLANNWEAKLAKEVHENFWQGGVQMRATETLALQARREARKLKWHQDFRARWNHTQESIRRHDAYLKHLDDREAAAAWWLARLDNEELSEDDVDLHSDVEDIEPWISEVTYYFGPHELDYIGNIFTLFDHTTLADLPQIEKRCIGCYGAKDEEPLPTVSLPCGHTFHQDCIAGTMTGGEDFCPLCTVEKRQYLFLAEPSWDDFHYETPQRFHWKFLRQVLNRGPMTEEDCKPKKVPYKDFEQMRSDLKTQKRVDWRWREWVKYNNWWYKSPPSSPAAPWVDDVAPPLSPNLLA